MRFDGLAVHDGLRAGSASRDGGKALLGPGFRVSEQRGALLSWPGLDDSGDGDGAELLVVPAGDGPALVRRLGMTRELVCARGQSTRRP